LVEFTGEVAQLSTIGTDLYSFNIATKGGLRLGSIYEIYGYTHVGKSSLAYFLAGQTALGRKIALADFEGFDPDYLGSSLRMANFGGTVDVLSTLDGEIALTGIRNALMDKEYGAAILDTVGALQSRLEIEAEEINLEERLGIKAKLMAKGMRAAMYALKRNPACFFVLNHLHPIITMGRGATTSGGVAIHNSAAGRIRLYVEKQHDDYQIVQGKMDKHRWGGKGAMFKFVIVPDRGVHVGMTALIDGIWHGHIEESRTVKIGDNSFGYMKNIAQEARDGNDKFFEPFLEVMDGVRMGANDNAKDSEERTDTSAGQETSK
jgi:RecA/RadA recombinase